MIIIKNKMVFDWIRIISILGVGDLMVFGCNMFLINSLMKFVLEVEVNWCFWIGEIVSFMMELVIGDRSVN